ncbi:MAG TPA: hypothetical protein VE178_09285 [Silvibacterium sp.]|nr:hypothetical protein [Silvibacterium sp.]
MLPRRNNMDLSATKPPVIPVRQPRACRESFAIPAKASPVILTTLSEAQGRKNPCNAFLPQQQRFFCNKRGVLLGRRHNSVPDHPCLDRFHPPEEIGLYLAHLCYETLRLFPRVEHNFVADLPGPQLLAFPQSIRHPTSFNS